MSMGIAYRKGMSFGLTSGIITTLGLIVGLDSATHSQFAVLGGVLIIAIADALSDSTGMHISEEAENMHTRKEIWGSMGATFISKFLIASSFIIPLMLLPLSQAVAASILWGILLLVALNIKIASIESKSPWSVVGEHIAIALLVIAATYLLGNLVSGLGP